MMRQLTVKYVENGMKINYGKTKYMVVRGNSSDLQINGCVSQRCDEFKYQGSLITVESNSKKDVSNTKTSSK